MRCFGGLVSSQRYRPDQQLEIYHFRVVPGLQMSAAAVAAAAAAAAAATAMALVVTMAVGILLSTVWGLALESFFI